MNRLLLLAMLFSAPMLHSIELDPLKARKPHLEEPKLPTGSFASSYDDAFQILPSNRDYTVFFPTDRALQGILHSPDDTFTILNDGLYMINRSFFYYYQGQEADVVGVAIVKNDYFDNIEPSPQVAQIVYNSRVSQDDPATVPLHEFIAPITLQGSLLIPLKSNDQLKLVIMPTRNSASAIRSAMISIVQVGS